MKSNLSFTPCLPHIACLPNGNRAVKCSVMCYQSRCRIRNEVSGMGNVWCTSLLLLIVNALIHADTCGAKVLLLLWANNDLRTLVLKDINIWVTLVASVVLPSNGKCKNIKDISGSFAEFKSSETLIFQYWEPRQVVKLKPGSSCGEIEGFL